MAIDNQFGKGIGLAAGFDLGSQKPLDSRVAVNTIAERDAHVTENRAYEGMIVFVDADKKNYQLINGEWVELVDVEGIQDAIDAAIEAAADNQELIDSEQDRRLGILEGLVVGGEGEGLSAVIADVAANKTAIETLNGDAEKAGSVANAVADEAKLREEADNDLSDRIAVFEANGANDVAALAEKVAANEDAIEIINGEGEGSIKKAVADLVDSAPDAMNTLNELAEAIKANEDVYKGYVEEHATAMANMKKDLQDEIDADVKVVADELAKQKDPAQEGTLAKQIADEKSRAELAEQGLDGRIDSLEEFKNAHDHSAMEGRLNALENANKEGGAVADAIKAAQDAADKAQGEVDDAELRLDAIEEDIERLDGADTVEGSIKKQIKDAVAAVNDRLEQNGDIENRIAQAESDIDGLQGLVGVPADGENEASGLHLALDNAKEELDQAILDEKDRAEEQERLIRQELADAIGNYAVEANPEQSIEGKAASGLRKEIAEADAAIRQEMAAAVAGVHQHENKEVLDGIDANKVAAWNAAQANAEAKAAELDAALKLELQGEIDADVAAEAKLREEADTALQQAVDAKVAQADYDVKMKALDDEDARIAGLVKAEEDRAKEVEEDHEGRIAANEAFVAAQPAIDAEQDRRLGVVEAAIGEGGATKEAIDAAKDAADAAQADVDAVEQRLDAEGGLVDRLEAAEAFVQAHSHEGLQQAIDNINDAEDGILAQAKADAKAKDDALHAVIKGEMAAVIQSLSASITEDGHLQIALGGIEGDEVLVIKQTKVPFVTDDEIDEIIAGLDPKEEEPEA